MKLFGLRALQFCVDRIAKIINDPHSHNSHSRICVFHTPNELHKISQVPHRRVFIYLIFSMECNDTQLQNSFALEFVHCEKWVQRDDDDDGEFREVNAM